MSTAVPGSNVRNWGGSFFKALAERAVSTFLQTYLALWLIGDAALNVFEMQWLGPQLGIALGATLLSVVKGILANMGGTNGPSFANETVLPPRSVSDGL